jgi:hypothetical protein
MKKEEKYLIIILPVIGMILLVIALCFIFIFGGAPSAADLMKYCELDSDCLAVECNSCCQKYDDVINQEYAEQWFSENCEPPFLTCSVTSCLSVTVKCEDNTCVIQEPPSYWKTSR